MNILKGEIESVSVKNSLSLVKIRSSNIPLSVIVIDTPESAPYLKAGNMVKVIFKETEVIIGKNTSHEISLQNKLTGKITSIDSGELLSKLNINTNAGKVISVITSNAVKQLELEVGSMVTAMIKTNEMMLSYD